MKYRSTWIMNSLTISWKQARILLLLIAILVQMFYDFYHGPALQHDIGFQLGVADHIIESRNFGLPYALDSSDLSQITFKPLTKWPPTYSLLIVPIKFLTGDIWWAALILQWFTTIIFFISWFAILETLEDYLSISTRMVVWLYWIFLFNPVLSSTDGLALSMLSASLAILFRRFSVENQQNLYIIASGIMMGIALSLRYAYWPLIVVIPSAILLYALLNNQHRLIIDALLHSLVSIGGILAIISFNYTTSDIIIRETLRMDDHGGNILILKNLKSFVPFPSQSLGIYTSFSYLGQYLSIPSNIITTVAWVISSIFIATLFFILWQMWKKRDANGLHSAWVLFVIGALLMLVLVTYLSYLSVTAEKFWGWWIYIQDMRFFQPVIPIFTISIFTIIFQADKFRFPILRWMLVFILIISISTGLAYRYVNWRWMTRNFTFDARTKQLENLSVYSIIDSIEDNGKPIIYLQPSIFNQDRWYSQAALAGAIIYNGPVHDDTKFDATSPVILLVVIPEHPVEEEEKRLRHLISEEDGTLIATVPSAMEIYQIELTNGSD